MRLAFLELPLSERNLYFQQAALRRGLHPAIMEKDFWVCWLLGVLFGHPKFKNAVVFKGGTSLSKVFGAIQRFSEDIDLSLAPAFLGIAEDEVERAGSRTQRDRWMRRLEESCATAVRERIGKRLPSCMLNTSCSCGADAGAVLTPLCGHGCAGPPYSGSQRCGSA
jgi:hypothetical protein